MKKIWSDEEIILLKDLYEKKGLSKIEICPFFCEKYERSCESIWIKIKRLKLRHTKEQTRNIKSRLNSGDKNSMFGKNSPMKGLTKENSDLMKNKSIKLSNTRKQMFINGELPNLSGKNNPMFGKTPWNVGLTKENCLSLKLMGEKVSITQKIKWKNKTEDDKNLIIKRLNSAMIQSKTPTKIELKIKFFLDEIQINYVTNKKINNFLCDFYLPDYDFVIECDGDYWHVNPLFFSDKILTKSQIKNIDRDKRKNIMLNENKIPFLRFWEHDINKNFNNVKNKILFELENTLSLHHNEKSTGRVKEEIG